MHENQLRPIEDRLRDPLREYWLDRVRMHFHDSYLGIQMLEFPEDLRAYEHVLWQCRPSVVIEIGAHAGASALWFRDHLLTLARYGRVVDPRVIAIDLDVAGASANVAAIDPRYQDDIMFLQGDVCDPMLPGIVRALLPSDPRCLVVDDSAHTYETTTAALHHFAEFVPTGGYFIVEDGCVDIEDMRLAADWPRGVLPAIDDWLATEDGARFVVRRDLERYGLSCHPRGFLQRAAPE